MSVSDFRRRLCRPFRLHQNLQQVWPLFKNMDDFSSGAGQRPAQLVRGKIDDLFSRVAAAMDGARRHLFSVQHEDGYWCGELEADTTLESDYILLHTLLGTGNPERMRAAAREILRH